MSNQGDAPRGNWLSADDKFPVMSGNVQELATSLYNSTCKSGHKRGEAQDGAWYDCYFKALTTLNMKVMIGFTGSFVPEEQVPAAVTGLSFTKDGRSMPLGDVPKILLAESYADYNNVAKAGLFDPDWETKSEI